jgi:hypothetical protein
MAGGFAELNEDRENKLAAIHYKVPRRILRAHLVSLNWGRKLYFHKSRNKSCPRELLG